MEVVWITPFKAYDVTKSMKITSMDPAEKNLGVRVETRTITPEGTTTVPLLFQRINLEDEHSKEDLSLKIHNTLVQLNDNFVGSDYIFIERQNPTSRWNPRTQQSALLMNSKVMKIYGHIVEYFLCCHPNSSIAIVSPKLKGKMLQFPEKLTYAQTKSQSVKTARALLASYNDQVSLDLIKQAGAKKDDLCDTVCQIEAVLLYLKRE